ncbi:peptide deformylase [bacterium]|nr:peptide deformylase [bacterium]
MGWLNIRIYPDPILKKLAEEVSDIDEKIRKLIQDMTETMFFGSGGIGLAAPQVGIGFRLAVIDKSLGKKESPLVIINPKIIAAEGEVMGEEGCLSFPETYAPIKRAKRIEVEFINPKGKFVRMVVEDYLARVFQHEIDHLDGTLILDRMNRLRRDFIKMRYLKRMKRQGKMT